MKTVDDILRQAGEDRRITDAEALQLLHDAELLSLGQCAQQRTDRFHPDGLATFIIDRNINYTNICTSRCRFCAFYRDAESPEAYLLSHEEVMDRAADAVSRGATQIMLQGGLHPALPLDYVTRLVRSIKERFSVSVHSFSPPEIMHFAKLSNRTVAEVLALLRAAGLDSLPGGGAEILSDRVRSLVSPCKITSAGWLGVMETAHAMGMKTTATMMIGSVETAAERVVHLAAIRDLQDRTGGFRAFIPWSFKSAHTELGGGEISALEYLRTLAVSRIYLDNIAHIHGSWVTQGPDIGQVTLCFGANDLGSIMLEENVVRAAGASYCLTEEEMVKLIRCAGKIPAQRNTEYCIIKRYPH
jgi:cyclic dehypoxanthinyl futalosine synthase